MGKHKEKNHSNNPQVSSYISEGNPNTQKIPSSSDQQSAQMVRQAMKDDQGLSAVAQDIHVTVKSGTVTLDGQVDTDQQMNLATNTATAVAVDDKVKNRLKIVQGGKDPAGYAGSSVLFKTA